MWETSQGYGETGGETEWEYICKQTVTAFLAGIDTPLKGWRKGICPDVDDLSVKTKYR